MTPHRHSGESRNPCRFSLKGMDPGLRRGDGLFAIALLCFIIPLTTGCRQDMHNQPRFEPLEETSFYKNKRASRDSIEGTIPYGVDVNDTHLREGKINGGFTNKFPFPITEDVLKHGQERFNIHCAVCHDKTGSGRGMVVNRGFPEATSFHSKEIRNRKNGELFDVITNGKGFMMPAKERVSVKDRWAIVVYLRALQKSQNARIRDVPKEKRSEVKAMR